MGNNTLSRRISARRIATVLAALGALVMSSGIALMVAATPANATSDHVPVDICHATSSDTNPYVFITVDDDSAQLEAHMAHRNSPNKKWKSAGTWNGVDHVKGDPKPDLIGDYAGHELDGEITEALCEGDVTPPEETITDASVVFTNPTCENENTASWEGVGEHADFEVTSGTVAPGEDVVVTATVKDGYTFEDDKQTLEFPHSFPDAEEPCGSVEPPEVPEPQFVDPTCDTAPQVLLPEEQEGEVLSRTAAAPFLTKDVNGIHYEATGDLVPGGTVTVTATLIEGGDGPLATWKHTFTIPTGCTTSVLPPEETESNTVSTPTQSTVTPTVVHAGLAGASAEDVRGEQGLALMVAGMVMLVAAGGLRLRGSRSRI